MFGRRDFMLAGITLPLLSATTAAAESLRVVLLGQALIQHDLRDITWPSRDKFTQLFAAADATFTDLETTIVGPNGGSVTRDPALLHRADATVLDCLGQMHVNLFATANNHAFDVGTGGIIDTMAALDTRHLTYAGTGRNLEAAEAAAFLSTTHGEIALVAMATGKIREGGSATVERAGVNELRQSAPNVLDSSDVARFLSAISAAAKRARLVIAYDHNHYWEPNIADVPAWQVTLAHQCIDAGACVFVGHGAPLLQAIEIYRGRPIFYGLGNFLYQSPSSSDPYGPATWQSVVTDCRFGPSSFSCELMPITLNPQGVGGANDFVTKGIPEIAAGEAAAGILSSLDEKSQRFGTKVVIRDGIGRIGAMS